MADARGQTVTVRIGGTPGDAHPAADAEFSASGTVITFRGFLAAYEEGRDEDAPRTATTASAGSRSWRRATRSTVLSLEPDGHATHRPSRYTEAALVRALEERGIGRPSTYASIIGTILDRGYVFKNGSALVPAWLAFAAIGAAGEALRRTLVDYDFTAEMEEVLDQIAGGEAAAGRVAPALLLR